MKKDAIEGTFSTTKQEDDYDSPKDEWYKFDDDRVSTVKQEKITTLHGGGEDSTAYILLYRFARRISTPIQFGALILCPQE